MTSIIKLFDLTVVFIVFLSIIVGFFAVFLTWGGLSIGACALFVQWFFLRLFNIKFLKKILGIRVVNFFKNGRFLHLVNAFMRILVRPMDIFERITRLSPEWMIVLPILGVSFAVLYVIVRYIFIIIFH